MDCTLNHPGLAINAKHIWLPVVLIHLSVQATVLADEITVDSARKLNVLFLAVDDMKDWVNCLGGYEGTVHTPNIDRLAKKGMLFTNAHCPSPKCAPSTGRDHDGAATVHNRPV